MANGLIEFKVDDKNLKARLARILSKLDKNASLSVEEIARFGRDQIQLYMPKDTGASARSIGYQVVINSKNYHEAVIKQINFPHLDKKWNGEWFNLPIWMFNSDRAISHYRKSNGSIISMRNVKSTLQKEFYRRVRVKLMDPSIFK